MYFLPIPQYNNFHGSEVTTLLRHPLAEDFSGLELARDCEKSGEGVRREREGKRREGREVRERG